MRASGVVQIPGERHARKRRLERRHDHGIDADRHQHRRPPLRAAMDALGAVGLVQLPGKQAAHDRGGKERPGRQCRIAVDERSRQRHGSDADDASERETTTWRRAPATAAATAPCFRRRRRSGWRSPDRAAARNAAAWSRPVRTRSTTAPATPAEIARPARAAPPRPRAPPARPASSRERTSRRTAPDRSPAARHGSPARSPILASMSSPTDADQECAADAQHRSR